MESELSLVNSELTKFALENFQIQIRERRPQKEDAVLCFICLHFIRIE